MGGTCIQQEQVCDSFPDCEVQGDDEHSCNRGTLTTHMDTWDMHMGNQNFFFPLFILLHLKNICYCPYKLAFQKVIHVVL